MKCTILTDASYSHEKKKGGWACWIRYDDKKLITYSAAFKIHPDNSYLAERMAVINSIYIAIAKAESPLTSILVQTDNLQVCQQVHKHHVIADLGEEFVAKHGVPDLRIRHVRGHSRRKDVRFWCNNWCDKEARKRMREACNQ